ncbi:MAG: ATP-NAD kinase family protein, partial [Candidatus Thermoplasmatota archaeon]|nr:ATP-NAD kinase family protein [Candidatus Thermoplasmatota archaeon]
MRSLAFVLNPIAGMGGKVGLKGTDGVLSEAMDRGATPRSPLRAKEAIMRLAEAYSRHRLKEPLTWLTAGGPMGADLLTSVDCPFWTVEVVHDPKEPSTADDTKVAVMKAIEQGCELIVFCGGDGTARDVLSIAGTVPMFGIPAGVKMHSGVFGTDPLTAGELLEFYIRGDLTTGQGEVMDLDEELYRQGEWNIRLFGIGTTLYEPSFVQSGKTMVREDEIEDVISLLAEDVRDRFASDKEALFIMGPGGTLHSIGTKLGLDKTLLGVDAVVNGALISMDLDERSVLALVDDATRTGRNVFALVSPIGGQGFFLGRGNLQLSPEVIKAIGPENVVIIATPQKLEGTDHLRVDTGDHELDSAFRSMGYMRVLTGYRTFKLKK